MWYHLCPSYSPIDFQTHIKERDITFFSSPKQKNVKKKGVLEKEFV